MYDRPTNCYEDAATEIIRNSYEHDMKDLGCKHKYLVASYDLHTIAVFVEHPRSITSQCDASYCGDIFELQGTQGYHTNSLCRTSGQIYT